MPDALRLSGLRGLNARCSIFFQAPRVHASFSGEGAEVWILLAVAAEHDRDELLHLVRLRQLQ